MRLKPLADSETDIWWSKRLVSGRISDPASQSTWNWHCFCNTITWKIVGLGVGWLVMKFPQLLLISSIPRESLISFCLYLSFQFHHQTQGEQLMRSSMQSLYLSLRSPWGNQKPNSSHNQIPTYPLCKQHENEEKHSGESHNPWMHHG